MKSRFGRMFSCCFSKIQAIYRRAWQRGRRYLRSLGERYAARRKQDEYTFLPAYLEVIERPPAPWVRVTGWSMGLFLLLVLAWSIIGQLDIHASAPGRVIVVGHSKVIQPLEHSEIVSIEVVEGEYVKAGQVLIRFNPTDIQAHDQALHQQIAVQQADMARFAVLVGHQPLNAFSPSSDLTDVTRQLLFHEISERQAWLSHHDAQMRVNRSQAEAGEKHLQAQSRVLANVHQRLHAYRQAFKQQAVSKIQLLEQEREALDMEANLNQLNSHQVVLQSQYQALASQRHQYLTEKKREDQTHLRQASERLVQLQQEDIQAHDKQRTRTLHAPVAGRVQQLALHTLGAIATPAQQLMVIVPENVGFEVEALLLNKDVGFVFPGQRVTVKVDAFPYTQYGTLSGQVSHVSRDAVEDKNLGAVFPVRITLHHDQLIVDGQLRRLSAGMQVTAEIRTGQRRVIDYLLSPLQEYQSEAWRER